MSRTFRHQLDRDLTDPQRPRPRKVHGMRSGSAVGGAPTIGMRCDVRGVPCRVFRVHPAGTVDVEAVDGTDRAYRVSGLGVTRS